MRAMSLALVTLVVSGSVAAAQTVTAPRIDGEGINMDAPPPPTREPSHPADGYAPKASNPSAATAPGSKRAQVTGSCSSVALA